MSYPLVYKLTIRTTAFRRMQIIDFYIDLKKISVIEVPEDTNCNVVITIDENVVSIESSDYNRKAVEGLLKAWQFPDEDPETEN
jgi:hypothetical protein